MNWKVLVAGLLLVVPLVWVLGEIVLSQVVILEVDGLGLPVGVAGVVP